MHAKTIMVQGTGSSVGKSVLVTALCRVFKQQGFKVAPFKAQNMSLNSFVTAQGDEIGRAQAVQAEAAGIAPTVEMNPVLVKPESDHNAQVIVRGRPLTRISAGDFPRLKTELWSVITESIDRLRHNHDIVVIEGAGSPAEINLKERDLVNMRVALYCNAPVLLATDIERGGIFAALVGTMELLDAKEQERVKAFVVNKFRGDVSLLKPGLDWLEARTGVPVAGVVPYYYDIDIAEEDSIALEKRRAMKNQQEYIVDLAVIALPHISNFDDFDPLEREAGVRLRYVEACDELGEPNLIILPGTKSTVADLAYLRALGRDREIIEQVSRGVPVIGICGGYQMLGLSIQDLDGVESPEGMTTGLALLPVHTRFSGAKSTHQISGRVRLGHGLFAKTKGSPIQGYEIHMGQTISENTSPPFELTRRSSQAIRDFDGCASSDGNVIGTYLHGLFHNDAFRRGLLEELAARKGRPLAATPAVYSADEQYDRLATLVRESLNMDLILQLVHGR